MEKVRLEVATRFKRSAPALSRVVGYVDLRIDCEKLDLDYVQQPMGPRPLVPQDWEEFKHHWDVQLRGESSVIVSPFQLRWPLSRSISHPPWELDFYEACVGTYPCDIQDEIKKRDPTVYITHNPLIVNEFFARDVRVLLADSALDRAKNFTLHRLCDLPPYKLTDHPGEWWRRHISGDYSEPALLKGWW